MLHRKDDMELLFQLRARAKEGGGAGGGSRVRGALDRIFGDSFGARLFASDFVPSAYTVSCSLGTPMRFSTRTNREV